MSGYTPLFPSMFTGSLHGRWPDIGLWPIILALADRYGVVDVTPEYIASITGLALGDVVNCLGRFCEADDRSRTGDFAGARLVLLDSHRRWGWRVVNHAKYREKARLLSKAAQEVSSGINTQRMRGRQAEANVDAGVDAAVPPRSTHLPGRPQETADDRHSPPMTAADRPSDIDIDETKGRQGISPQAQPVPDPPGLDQAAWAAWQYYRKLKPKSVAFAKKKLAAFGADQMAVVEQSIANGWKGLFPTTGDRVEPKAGGRGLERIN